MSIDTLDLEHFSGGKNVAEMTGSRDLATIINEIINALNAANNRVLEESVGAAGPTAGTGAWEDVLSTSITVLEGQAVAAIATLDPACSGAGGAFEARVMIDGTAGPVIEWDKGAAEAEAVCVQGLKTGLTAGAIAVKVQVKDDASVTLTTAHAQISAVAVG